MDRDGAPAEHGEKEDTLTALSISNNLMLLNNYTDGGGSSVRLKMIEKHYLIYYTNIIAFQ